MDPGFIAGCDGSSIRGVTDCEFTCMHCPPPPLAGPARTARAPTTAAKGSGSYLPWAMQSTPGDCSPMRPAGPQQAGCPRLRLPWLSQGPAGGVGGVLRTNPCRSRNAGCEHQREAGGNHNRQAARRQQLPSWFPPAPLRISKTAWESTHHVAPGRCAKGLKT